jgi:hypothetical protein
MNELLSGSVAMGSMTIALVFLRFWRDSRDRFFLYFALSFAVQAGHRIYATLSGMGPSEDHALHYAIRLIAYGLIIWAVMEKNLRART